MSGKAKENIQEQYMGYLSTLPGMAHAIDKEGLLIGVSDLWLTKMGYQKNEVLGRKSLEFLTDESREFAINVAWPKLFKDNLVENIPYHFVTKDRSVIDVLLSANSVFDTDGNYICSLAIITDITDKTRAEKALKESEDKFKYVFDRSVIGKSISFFDGELRTNAAFRKMLGIPEDEIETFTWMEVTHTDDVAKSQQVVDSLLSGEKEFHSFRKRYLHRDGSVVWADVTTTLRRDENSDPLYLITTATDITDRKQREEVQNAQLKLVEYGSAHTSEELLVRFVDEAENLTNSKVGFYHFFDEKKNHLSLITWSSNTVGKMCQVESSVTHYPLEKAGVWADCIREQKPIIHNDYMSLSHKMGLPEGHANIIRELVVPVIRGGHVVAVLGVGNKESDYTEADSRAVQELADLGWETVCRKLAEELLYENEQEFRSFFEHNPISSWLEDFSAVKERFDLLRKEGITDLDAYLTEHPKELQEIASSIVINDVNQATLDLHKAEDKQQLIQGLGKTFTPESFAAFKEEVIDLWSGKTHGSHDGVVKTLDGEFRYVQMSYRILPGYEETFKKVVISLVDNTAKWLAEQKVKESEEKFRALFEQAGGYCMILDPNTPDGIPVIVAANEAACEMHGYEHDEFVGQPVSLIDDEAGKRLIRARTAEIMTGKPFYVENEHLRKDGTSFYVAVNAKRIDIGNKPPLILSTEYDITERKKAEKELLASEARYRMIFDSAKDILFLHELDTPEFPGYFLEVNSIASEVLGYSQEEFQKLRPTTIITNSDLDTVATETKTLLSSDKMMFEKNLVTKDGQLIPVELHANLFEYEGKTLVLSIGRDVSERRRLEANLRQAQKMESIGNLAGGIAHDFNNILSAIIGFTELALDAAPKGSSQKDDLDEVYIAGKRAKKLVQQILAFARQSDKETKPIRFSDVVTEVSQLLRASTPVNIDIQLHIESTAKVMANTTQLHQAVMNLCTNSIHSLQKTDGMLEIDLRDIHLTAESKVSGLSAGDYAELTITDNGSGIDPRIIDNIFEPYFTTKGVGEGTGMGLAMVKGIVESYGGDITVSSTLGERTSFVVRLPVATGKSSDIQSQTDSDAKGAERVLFVDDEPPIARMGSRILETLGYTVITRTSSFEALELFKEKPEAFDLVVTDMTMPAMTGDELSIEIRKIRRDIPIIICTGYSNKLNDDGVKRIGVNALAYKPLTKSDLAKTVREVLDNS